MDSNSSGTNKKRKLTDAAGAEVNAALFVYVAPHVL